MNKTFQYSVIASCLIFSTISFAQSETPDKYPQECQPVKGQTPPWLKTVPDPATYTSQPWYKNWMLTTLSLCANLTQAKVDDLSPPPKPAKKLFWRDDAYPLFRGGKGRTTEEIFKFGFYPWLYNGEVTMPTYVQKTSSLTSTGYWPWYTFAEDYGIHRGNQGFVIDAPGGINQDVTVDYQAHGTDANIKARNVVVFPGGIRSEFIKGVFSIKDKKLVYESNPGYRFPAPKPDEFDLILTAGQESSADPFKSVMSATPAGIKQGVSMRYKKGTSVQVTIVNGNPQYCWYINDIKKKEVIGDTLHLNSTDESLPAIVIWRGSCGK